MCLTKPPELVTYARQRGNGVRLVVHEESSHFEVEIGDGSVVAYGLEALTTQRVPDFDESVVASRRQREIVQRDAQAVDLLSSNSNQSQDEPESRGSGFELTCVR